jgi:hypothetical protein
MQKEIDDQGATKISSLLPEEIIDALKDLKLTENTEMENAFGLQAFRALSRIKSQFIPKSTRSKYNIVMSAYTDNEKICGFRLSDLEKENEISIVEGTYDADYDALIFHEFNHCRHFLSKTGTFKEDCNSKDNVTMRFDKPFDDYVGVGVRLFCSQDYSSNLMKNAEEELQLNGYTRIKKNKIIRDETNEINYRVLGGKDFIRIPYMVPDTLSGKPLCIKYEDAKAYLKNAGVKI